MKPRARAEHNPIIPRPPTTLGLRDTLTTICLTPDTHRLATAKTTLRPSAVLGGAVMRGVERHAQRLRADGVVQRRHRLIHRPSTWALAERARPCYGSVYLDEPFFFFSSRRRHTRFDCDWSSDVCSSDLKLTCNWAISTPTRINM